MFQYEEFLEKSFPYLRGVFNVAHKTPFQITYDRAIRFLEMNCSPVFGFPEEAHHFHGLTPSISYFPSPYGSALLLPMLVKEDINHVIIDTLVNVLKKSRRSSSFWNYFMSENDKSFSLFPDDVDDTSLALAALHQTGHVSTEECMRVGRIMIEHFNGSQCGEGGEMGTWLPPAESCASSRTIIIKKLLSPPRIDVGSIANTLWFLTGIGLESEYGLDRSVKFIDTFLEKHMQNTAVKLDCMSYYTNPYVIYYFVSRYVAISSIAKNMFGTKFAGHLKATLATMTNQDAPHALDISCLLLALMNFELHENEPTRKHMRVLLEKLLQQQGDDGSFPPWNVFRWNKIGHYGGSKSFTTAICLSMISRAKKCDIIPTGN